MMRMNTKPSATWLAPNIGGIVTPPMLETAFEGAQQLES